MTEIVIGGDVAKSKIDFAIKLNDEIKEFEIKNKEMNLLNFVKKQLIHGDLFIAFEATGIYHLKLVKVLEELKVKYSIVNPVKIANHAKTMMQRGKTDKGDAKLIMSYAIMHKPEESKLDSTLMIWAQSILKSIDGLHTVLSSIKHRNEAYINNPFTANEVLDSTNSTITYLENEIYRLEQLLIERVKFEKPKEYQQLKNICGVGDKIACTVIGYFGSFEKFDSAKKVVGFIGLDPSPRESGYFKGKARISKKGNRYIRKMLYMASLSAGTYNSACRALNDRLKEKGKPNGQIRIAIAGKLMRQIFAVVKYDREWNNKYVRC